MSVKRNLQSRMANLKFVSPSPESVLSFIRREWPGDSISVLWALHPQEDTTPPHCHMVVRFPATTRWTKLACWLHEQDGHEYAQPAQSWRRSCRYLRHLDNPEKCPIPVDAFHFDGIDPDEVATLMGSQRLPILESLILAERMPLSRRFAFLVVERGHAPSEVSSALRCMMDLERWSDSRTARAMHAEGSALPSPEFPSEPSDTDFSSDAGDGFGTFEDWESADE